MPFEGLARQLFITKMMLRKPFVAMNNRAQEILNGKADSRDSLRYFIYSVHDTQMGNIYEWLNALDHDYVDIPYGSSLFFELHYDTECVAEGNLLLDCFEVHVTHNGEPLKFDTCIEANLKNGSKSQTCKYNDFITHINKQSF